MSGLSEVINTANTRGLSGREIARRAQQRGHTLNHDTAARYLRGDHGTPDEATLVALAQVLEVPLRTLRTAADLPAESTTLYVPPVEASRLTRRQRRAVDEIIRAMLDQGAERAGTGTGNVADLPTRRAARHGEPEPPTD
ncbi:MAG: hypothetical protein ACRDQ1_21380 [Sciscionella sp.]